MSTSFEELERKRRKERRRERWEKTKEVLGEVVDVGYKVAVIFGAAASAYAAYKATQDD